MSEKELRLDDFLFPLDESLIAQEPLEERSSSRLLVREQNGTLSDRVFKDLETILPPECVLVVNDSRVFPSRLFGRLPTGGKVEILLLEKSQNEPREHWVALAKPGRKLTEGTRVILASGLEAQVVEATKGTSGAAPLKVAFSLQGAAFRKWLEEHGIVPLPPYIRRDGVGAHGEDKERYQTVYAREEGSAAAPTAGLHFTVDLVERLKKRSIVIHPITLHVGLGTFLPVKEQDLSKHPMHEERFLVPPSTCDAILAARNEGRPVIAIGTTSLRCMEAFFERFQSEEEKGAHASEWLSTDLFIRPVRASDRYKPLSADGLVTNFHLPGSTLFMLVSALIGWEEAKRLYAHAAAKRYRFFSYGDASFLKFGAGL